MYQQTIKDDQLFLKTLFLSHQVTEDLWSSLKEGHEALQKRNRKDTVRFNSNLTFRNNQETTANSIFVLEHLSKYCT